MESSEIVKLISKYKSLEIINEGQKVKCNVTGHEMPCQVSAIQSYINGKRFKRYCGGGGGEGGGRVGEVAHADPSLCKEFLVPSNKPGKEKQLFCKLTYRHVNNLPHHIAIHLNGRRFRTAHARWKQCQETGEVFKANIGRCKPRDDSDSEMRERRKKKERKSTAVADGEEDEADDDDDDTDSLSDLYPVDCFTRLDIGQAGNHCDGVAEANGDWKDEDDDLGGSSDEMNGSGHSNDNNNKPKKKKKKKASVIGDDSASSLKSGKKRKLEKSKKPAVLKTVKAKKPKQ